MEPKALDKKVSHHQNMSNKKHPIMTMLPKRCLFFIIINESHLTWRWGLMSEYHSNDIFCGGPRLFATSFNCMLCGQDNIE